MDRAVGSASEYDFRQIKGPQDSKNANFEELCNQLVHAEYPEGLSVDGRGGDSGIDCFVRCTNGHIYAFQHKYFCGTLSHSQRRQIVHSFETAFGKGAEVDRWTLCISKNFTPSELQWFEKEIVSKRPHVAIHCWDATALRERLSRHPGIASQFFPDLYQEIVLPLAEVMTSVQTAISERLDHFLERPRIYKELFAVHNVLCALSQDLGILFSCIAELCEPVPDVSRILLREVSNIGYIDPWHYIIRAEAGEMVVKGIISEAGRPRERSKVTLTGRDYLLVLTSQYCTRVRERICRILGFFNEAGLALWHVSAHDDHHDEVLSRLLQEVPESERAQMLRIFDEKLHTLMRHFVYHESDMFAEGLPRIELSIEDETLSIWVHSDKTLGSPTQEIELSLTDRQSLEALGVRLKRALQLSDSAAAGLRRFLRENCHLHDIL